MADIFLSYSQKDLERARDIAVALESEGWSVFWDRLIPPGFTFEDYIEKEISECRVVVVLWSPQSTASKWVKLEAAHARDRQPSVLIPILIQPAQLPFAFRDLHAANLCKGKPRERGIEFEQLLGSIEALAPRKITKSSP